MAAVKATPYSPSAKMGLQMKRRFWEEDDKIFGGHLYSNLPFGNFSYPSWGYFGNKGVLLGFYGNGQMSGVVNMPDQGPHRARADARQQGASADSRRVRDGLLHVLGKDAVQPGRVRGRRWRRQPPSGWPCSASRTIGSSSDARLSAETAAGRKARSRPPGNR